MTIYLDHQASSPALPRVVAAMMPHFAAANPHAHDHSAGWAAAEAVATARRRIAARVEAGEDEVLFTSGATESNNIAILGAAAAASDRRKGVVVAAVEHKSVLAPVRALAARGFEVRVVGVDGRGVVDLAAMAAAIGPSTLLVSLMAVNNEVGSIQPVPAVAAMAARAGALFHCDAAQALSWMELDVGAIGADLMSLSSHKTGGPAGVGALFVRRGARHRIGPVSFGGEQEDGLRPGTLPTALCVGFGEACAAAPDARTVARWRSLTRRLEEGLRGVAPDLVVHGHPERRHPGNLNVRFPGQEADAMIARMQPRLAIARGSACVSGLPEPSHVLRAMGLSPPECEEAIRFSTSASTTVDDVDAAVAIVAESFARPS